MCYLAQVAYPPKSRVSNFKATIAAMHLVTFHLSDLKSTAFSETC